MSVVQTLRELGLTSLAEHEHVIAISDKLPALDDKHAVLVGTPTVELVRKLEGKVGLIVPLSNGRNGLPRSAAAGEFTQQARDILDAAGAVYLGDKAFLAAAYPIVEKAMWATNSMIALEAFSLALKNGVNLDVLFDALGGGAAGTQGFWDTWPALMRGDKAEAELTKSRAHKALVAVTALAKDEVFYAPLFGLAKQIAVAALPPLGHGSTEPPRQAKFEVEDPIKVGFVGLGAMGGPMSLVLHNAGLNVEGYDVWDGARETYKSKGGKLAADAVACAKNAEVYVLIVVNAPQVEEILFNQGAVKVLAPDASILVMATIPSSAALALSAKVKAVRPDVTMIDCPVSGAVPRAATGDLMVFSGGLDASRTRGKALRVLKLFSGSLGNDHYLIRMPSVGQGSAIKLSNQHLGGSQISCCAETLAFCASLGMQTRQAHKLLMNGEAYAWVMGHRGVSMLNGLIQPPTAAIDIFYKDMGIVVAEAEALGVSVPIAGLAQQQFIFCKSLGWGKDDDSGLVRVWEFAGIKVAQD